MTYLALPELRSQKKKTLQPIRFWFHHIL